MYGRLAQLVERGANNAKAGGSSPSMTKLYSVMVQWLGFLAFTEKAGVRFPVSETSQRSSIGRAFDCSG